MSADRVGHFTVDEDMGLDAIQVSLVKNGERVNLTMAVNPEPGRYEITRGDPT